MNKILKVIYSLHFLNDGFKTVIIVLLPFIAKDLHLSLTQVGFLGASQGIFASLLAAPMGILISRIGGIKIIFGSLLLYSLCAFGIGISPNIIFLFILFYLAGAGFAPFHIVGQSLTARISGKNNLGRNMGTVPIYLFAKSK